MYLFRRYLMRELIWHESIFNKALKDGIFYIYFVWERASVPLLMFSAKQGKYWYHFITPLVWRGPWLGIKPRTSCTRSQHSTTRPLSRRRYIEGIYSAFIHSLCIFVDILTVCYTFIHLSNIKYEHYIVLL